MKAKIRKTGETIEVTRNDRGEYVDENCVAYNIESLVFEYEENDRWRYITEGAAIAALQGLLANPHSCYGDGTIKEDIVSKAMFCAYKLVNKLKEE